MFTTILIVHCRRKKASDAFKKLRAFVEDARRHTKRFSNNVPTYNDRLKTDLRKAFVACLIKLSDVTREFVKRCGFWGNRTVDVNFGIVDDISQALKSGLCQIGPGLHAIDYNELLVSSQIFCVMSAFSFSGGSQISSARIFYLKDRNSSVNSPIIV